MQQQQPGTVTRSCISSLLISQLGLLGVASRYSVETASVAGSGRGNPKVFGRASRASSYTPLSKSATVVGVVSESVGVTSSASSQKRRTDSSFHSVWMAIRCQTSSNLCRVSSSPLSTNHHLTLLSLALDLYFRLTDRSLVEMLVIERIAPVTAETVVDLSVPQTFLAPFSTTHGLEDHGFSCPT